MKEKETLSERISTCTNDHTQLNLLCYFLLSLYYVYLKYDQKLLPFEQRSETYSYTLLKSNYSLLFRKLRIDIRMQNYLKNTRRTSTFRAKALRRVVSSGLVSYTKFLTKGVSLETSKFSLYFSGSCIPINPPQLSCYQWHHLHKGRATFRFYRDTFTFIYLLNFANTKRAHKHDIITAEHVRH